MINNPMTDDALCATYLAACESVMRRIHAEEAESMEQAAVRMAGQIAANRLVDLYGPGGQSNLAVEEVFYRAGGLMHMSPILDEGTLLSNGALRSAAIERLPGYGVAVIDAAGIGDGDLLLIVNALGVNSAVIDSAVTARARGAFLLGLNSHVIARSIPADHPARHPSGANLHDLVDIAIDTKIPDGDAAVKIDGLDVAVGPVSGFANAFPLNALMLRTIAALLAAGHDPALWRSRNAAAGDRDEPAQVEAMRKRVACL
jgi:uncharacterized phosphosugar-binding protein